MLPIIFDIFFALFCHSPSTAEMLVLLNPKDNETVLSNPPQLRWTSSNQFAHYHLQVSLRDDFLDLIVDIDTLANNEYDSLPLLSLKTYYWRIRGQNDMGDWSKWTHPQSFRTRIGVIGKISDCDAYDCAISDSFAFVACYTTYRIVDIKDKQQPKVVRRRVIASSMIEYYDGYLYTVGDVLTNDLYHLTITDVTDPLYPRIYGKCKVDPSRYEYDGYGIVADGQSCYITKGGLVIIDVSDREQPYVLARVSKPQGYYTAIDKVRSFLWVVGAWDGVTIFDVSDPANPHEVATYNIDHYICSITIIDTLAFMAGEFIEIADISDVSRIKTLCSFEGPARAITGAGRYLMVTKDKAIEIYDISDVSSPSFVGDVKVFTKPIYKSGSIDANGVIYLAAGKQGFLILKIRE